VANRWLWKQNGIHLFKDSVYDAIGSVHETPIAGGEAVAFKPRRSISQKFPGVSTLLGRDDAQIGNGARGYFLRSAKTIALWEAPNLQVAYYKSKLSSLSLLTIQVDVRRDLAVIQSRLCLSTALSLTLSTVSWLSGSGRRMTCRWPHISTVQSSPPILFYSNAAQHSPSDPQFSETAADKNRTANTSELAPRGYIIRDRASPPIRGSPKPGAYCESLLSRRFVHGVNVVEHTLLGPVLAYALQLRGFALQLALPAHAEVSLDAPAHRAVYQDPHSAPKQRGMGAAGGAELDARD
jgi:hypothetical protein